MHRQLRTVVVLVTVFLLGAVVGVVFGLVSWELWFVFGLALGSGLTLRWLARRPDGSRRG
jgi:O-antigen/teichoic acid export membrane protein